VNKVIQLTEVSGRDWREVCGLAVSEEQVRFVAYNSYSLAQAFYEVGSLAFSIYSDDMLVGFALIQDKGEAIWIVRLMIDQRFQKRGHGREALVQLRRRFPGRRLMTSYVPENQVAARLYESSGFARTGEFMDGEIVMSREV
jgi:diamine N-acetyltransferase